VQTQELTVKYMRTLDGHQEYSYFLDYPRIIWVPDAISQIKVPPRNLPRIFSFFFFFLLSYSPFELPLHLIVNLTVIVGHIRIFWCEQKKSSFVCDC
jgi:hypothetical protein